MDREGLQCIRWSFARNTAVMTEALFSSDSLAALAPISLFF
jgi:hypothetical protein